jgi:hypothetical protein
MRSGWAEHVSRMKDEERRQKIRIETLYKTANLKNEWDLYVGLQSNIKMNVREIGGEDGKWMKLT